MKSILKSLTIVAISLFFLNLNAATSDSAPAKKATLNFYYYGVGGGGPEESKITKELIENFKKENPGVDVNIIPVPFATDNLFDYFNMLLNTSPTESDIDVFTVDSAWTLILKDNILDLAPYSPKSLLDDYYPNVLDCYSSIENKKQVIYAYPWYCDIGLLFYREDLLKKYKIAPPQTWKELEDAALYIKEQEAESNNEIAGFVWQGYAYEGLTCNALEWIHSNNGGNIVNKERDVTILNKNAVEALMMATSWIGRISPQTVLYMKEDDSISQFKSGNAVFVRGWPFFIKSFNAKDSKIKGKFNFTEIPRGKCNKNSGVLGGWGLAVNKASKNKELAVKLVKYLTTKQALKTRAITSIELPGRKSFYEDKDICKNYNYFLKINEAIKNGFSRPIHSTAPNYSYVSKEFDLSVYNILNKKQSVLKALQDFTERLLTMGFKEVQKTNVEKKSGK